MSSAPSRRDAKKEFSREENGGNSANSLSGASTETAPGYHTFKASGQQFEVPTNFSLIRPIGHGAYGVVISALDSNTGKKVAIKKIRRAFDDRIDAKRILREIKLMQKFVHENVSQAHD